MKIDIDLRLIEVSFELSALEDHLKLIKKHITYHQEKEKLLLHTEIRGKKLTPDDPEWHEAYKIFDNKIDLFFPRIYRNPFLVSLYSVYECAVIEIAKLIQKKRELALSLDDIRGKNFLERSEKYFKHVIHFDLYNNAEDWGQIKILSILRNAIAHTNGRIEMLKNDTKEKIQEWRKKKIGIEDNGGYIIISEDFLYKTLYHVKNSLSDLVERYKEWGDK
jgi:hypothetical protein